MDFLYCVCLMLLVESLGSRGTKSFGKKAYGFLNYCIQLFLFERKRLQKEAKTLQVYRFVSFYQTIASYRAAPRTNFHSQARKNCTEQPPHLAVKARLFITARDKTPHAHMRVSASEPQHFPYSRSLHAEFRQAVFADTSIFHSYISGVRRKRLL